MRNIKEHITHSLLELDFNKKYHTYTNSITGAKYPPVTTLVEGHAEPFDAEAMLPYSAKKEGTTVDELRRRWILTNTTACELGTDVHDFLEKFDGSQVPRNGYEEAGIKYIKSLSKRRKILFRELRMYSKRYKYAGTSDLLLEDYDIRELVIGDYKTNGDLFKAYGYLKPPFDYLESSPFNKYQLQLCYYQIALEDIGCKIGEREIIHLKAGGDYRVFHGYDFSGQLREHLKKSKLLMA